MGSESLLGVSLMVVQVGIVMCGPPVCVSAAECLYIGAYQALCASVLFACSKW